MSILRVPSLQHLARNWHDKPTRIQSALVGVARHPPIFSYNSIFGTIRDRLLLHVSYEQIVEGIKRGTKREADRENFLEILPLLNEFLESISPAYVHTVKRRYYPVGRGLMVPFEPPVVYGENGVVRLPWFSFWRTNPLSAKRLSLFVTIVDEILREDPDLENAHFFILDFSLERVGGGRTLEIIDGRDIPRLNDAEKIEMLTVFAEGYFLALEELAKPAPQNDAHEKTEDTNQLSLLDLK